MSDIVQKLWGFCHTLRHDGIDYGDYIEQITYLLFLKMADETRHRRCPRAATGRRCATKSGTALTDHYTDCSASSARQRGILGDIYAERQSRFNNPVNLKRLINLIDETEWTALGRRREGRGLRGPAGKGRQRGQEGRGAIFHAARADPVHRPLHEARPARQAGLHHLRSRLRHRRLPRRRLRMAHEPDQGRRPRPRHRQAHQEGRLLRPGPGRPPAPAGADESLPARPGAAHRAGRLDLRGARRPTAST